MEIEDEAEEDSCPSDELVQLMKQEVSTYRKSLKREIADVRFGRSESSNAHAGLETTS